MQIRYIAQSKLRGGRGGRPGPAVGVLVLLVGRVGAVFLVASTAGPTAQCGLRNLAERATRDQGLCWCRFAILRSPNCADVLGQPETYGKRTVAACGAIETRVPCRVRGGADCAMGIAQFT